MRLSELKKLVDAAHEQMTKHREDPQVGLYFLDSSQSGGQRHRLLDVEFAEIASAGNLRAHSMDLMCSLDMVMQPDNRTLFILGDDANEEFLH